MRGLAKQVNLICMWPFCASDCDSVLAGQTELLPFGAEPMKSIAHVYILGDADRVREKIERFLFAKRLEELASFSATLTCAVSTLVASVERELGAATIMAGGDDVCFIAPLDMYRRASLERLSLQFFSSSGCSISFGAGTSIQEAYLNLRKAKSLEGGCVVDDGICHEQDCDHAADVHLRRF